MNYNRNRNDEYTTETIMFYTRCYTQYGLLIKKLNYENTIRKNNEFRTRILHII
jgi:hypothetical protein